MTDLIRFPFRSPVHGQPLRVDRWRRLPANLFSQVAAALSPASSP